MINRTFRHQSSRLVAATSIGAAVLLAGCAPEAPPCNDPVASAAILEMVGNAHDEHLKGYPLKAKDLASFQLETPTVTAYDDKLKIRSCKTTFTTTIDPAKVEEVNTFMKVAGNPLMDLADRMTALGAMFGGKAQGVLSDQAKADAFALKMVNPGPVTAEPIRKSLVYQIQKEEGSSNQFVATTNVDVSPTILYLRVAAHAHPFVQQAKERADKQAKAAQERQAQIDRLSAAGNWRKAVYILDFRFSDNDPYSCQKNGLYCLRGRDNDNDTEEVHYELDASRVSARGDEILTSFYRSRQPVCLVNIRKTARPGVFSAQGWSTFQNDKGELVDCLPGAEKTDWNATLTQAKKDQPAAVVAAPQTAAPAQKGAAATPTSGNLMSLIDKYEMCGQEALCLYTARGNTVWMNMATLDKTAYALLDRSVQKRQPICLREVTQDGKDFTAEAVAERC